MTENLEVSISSVKICLFFLHIYNVKTVTWIKCLTYCFFHQSNLFTKCATLTLPWPILGLISRMLLLNSYFCFSILFL